jgi:histidine triad (HIT) family protein
MDHEDLLLVEARRGYPVYRDTVRRERNVESVPGAARPVAHPTSGNPTTGRFPDMNDHRPTIFDKIISGEVPSHRVHEDDHVLAFLDIGPLSQGHTLVVPKERKAHLHQLSDESSAAIGRILPRICRAVLAATGATSYNILQNNGPAAHQAVTHVHFHVIPRIGDTGLGITWPAGELDPDTAATLLTRMKNSLAEE